ncbi:hypothetical protein D047_3048B, partial [Vibrio parahaemolyticus VPTS-2010_2]
DFLLLMVQIRNRLIRASRAQL